jgi:hypothetical protein
MEVAEGSQGRRSPLLASLIEFSQKLGRKHGVFRNIANRKADPIDDFVANVFV